MELGTIELPNDSSSVGHFFLRFFIVSTDESPNKKYIYQLIFFFYKMMTGWKKYFFLGNIEKNILFYMLNYDSPPEPVEKAGSCRT